MLPADIIAEITTNLAALDLQPNAAAQILAAVLAPLLRSSAHLRDPKPAPKHAARPRSRKAPRRKQAKPSNSKPRDARDRALAALKANRDASLTVLAKTAGVSRSTVVLARDELAGAARRKPGPKPKPAPDPKVERRQRAQQFLQDALAHGPRRVSDVEEAAAKAHVDPQALGQARADLGVLASRANTGSTLSVQWSLPPG